MCAFHGDYLQGEAHLNQSERLLYLSAQLMLLNMGDGQQKKEEIKMISSELAAVRRQMEKDGEQFTPPSSENCVDGFVKFTKKEISQMPSRFRKLFVLGGYTVRGYKRISSTRGNKQVINYELRCRSEGYNIYASSNNFEKVKQKFLETLKATEEGTRLPEVPVTFHSFAMYYFEHFRRKRVAVRTMECDLARYKRWLQPHFGEILLKSITPVRCQSLLDDIAAKGLGKTTDEIHSLMSVIFKAAIVHGIIQRNPLALVFHQEHERKHGVALTKSEEKRLLEEVKGTEFEIPFAIALYTGLRPNEYETVRIEGDFIIAVNSKRKTKRTEYKKIPISPMLRPFLNPLPAELVFPCYKRMREKYLKILPAHILYDMRTTFYTRCKECGVDPAARDEFVGHSLGKLGNTYTDLSDDFLLREGAKLSY